MCAEIVEIEDCATTVAVLQQVRELRNRGIHAWRTPTRDPAHGSELLSLLTRVNRKVLLLCESIDEEG